MYCFCYMLSNAFAHGEIFTVVMTLGLRYLFSKFNFLGKGMDWKLTFAEKKQAEN